MDINRLPTSVSIGYCSHLPGRPGLAAGGWFRVTLLIGAVLGAAAVIAMRQILPYALAFAAGAMIFVVVEELIPEAMNGKNTDVPLLARCWVSLL